MFCFQCQEATKGIACEGKAGYCGKSDEVADLQDLLIYMLKGISLVNMKAIKLNVNTERTDKFIFMSLFQTITNGNFDKNVFINAVKIAVSLRDEIIKTVESAGGSIEDNLHDSVYWTPKDDNEISEKSTNVGVLDTENEDIRSLRELVIYGVKGIAAYAEHAFNLGHKNTEIYKFMQKALAATTDDSLSAEELVALVMETGKFGVDVMALLDTANTSTYGNPEISKVNLGVRKNPAILVSGHDLKDLDELLQQTKGTGVDVYTHSEMLPAHYYPAFKKYDNFVGN